MTYLIQVTEDDIREGEADNCFECPVSIALEREIGTCCTATQRKIQVWNGKGFDSIQTPITARDFIANFDEARPDHRREPEPFSFEIELP